MSSEEEKQTASEGVALLEERLQYSFQSKELLLYALTHRSATNKEKRNDYERLEFLGDAVLDLVVADLLLQAHPEAREGELSKMRAALVNTTSLAEIARELELNKFILVSRAERAQAGHERPSILADVMESLIGAIYREAGFEKARTVASALFGRKIINVDPTDPKTELQEALHTLSLDPPEYLLDYVEGPEHAPTFISVVKVDGEILGRGEGGTKKASQQKAAEEALTVLSPRLEEIRRGHVQSSEVNGEEVQGDGSVSEELVSAEDIREEGVNE